jgi:PD-(D/E)XK nuclease family transposase
MHFLDPTNDIVFQRIFGDGQRTTSLISLINAVLELEGDARVVRVDIITKSVLPKLDDLKDPIVDVRATDGRGHQFIVEMQCRGGSVWMKRALFTTCKAYVNQLSQGDEHSKLMPVYFIGVLNFEMPWADVLEAQPVVRKPGPKPIAERQGRSWLTHHGITDLATRLPSTRDISMHFIELPAFKKQLQDCVSIVEQWAWFFKHGKKEGAIPSTIQDAGIVDAFNVANQHGWSAEELEALENMQWARMLARSELEEKHAAGKAEGLVEGEAKGLVEGQAKGLAQGQAEATRNIARNLAAAGMSAEAIAGVTAASTEQVRAWLTIATEHPSS